jgi:NADPH-dependent 2,4-dienoyl-CoA reductase/sulfur reductase-like enzyme
MHLLIVGGSDAGISAALRAHELDPGAEVTIAVADDFPNFSICGLPYYLSGETPDWRDLAHRTGGLFSIWRKALLSNLSVPLRALKHATDPHLPFNSICF